MVHSSCPLEMISQLVKMAIHILDKISPHIQIVGTNLFKRLGLIKLKCHIRLKLTFREMDSFIRGVDDYF